MTIKRHLNPLHYLFLLCTCLVYIWGLRLGEIVQERVSANHIFLFTLLMACHFGMYCLYLFSPSRYWLRLTYYLVQTTLVLSVSLVSGSLSVTLGLYPGLISNIVGSLRSTWLAVTTILLELIILSVNVEFLSDGRYLRITLLLIIPLFLVIIGYSLLFAWQTRAREQAQTLLQELKVAHTQLADYALFIEELTRDAERRRMARELHDTLAQGLVGLILQLEATKSHLVDHHYERSLEIVEQAMGRARATLADARGSIANLRKKTLDPANLEQTIQEEIHHFTLATGITCNAPIECLSSVPPYLCEHILRMINEGLTNVARHAQHGIT